MLRKSLSNVNLLYLCKQIDTIIKPKNYEESIINGGSVASGLFVFSK